MSLISNEMTHHDFMTDEADIWFAGARHLDSMLRLCWSVSFTRMMNISSISSHKIWGLIKLNKWDSDGFANSGFLIIRGGDLGGQFIVRGMVEGVSLSLDGKSQGTGPNQLTRRLHHPPT